LGLFVKCSAKSSCDASSCLAGCCDVTGVCQQGDADDACGPPGSGMCAVCAVGSSCSAGACAAPDAGSGGSGGSGGGTGGGNVGLGGGGDGLPLVCDGGQDLCERGVCVDGVCIHDNMDSGMGGGGTGGGSSAGSGAFTCSSTRTVAVFTGPVVDAGYEFFNWMELANPDPASLTDGGTWDALDLELFAQNQANQPIPGITELDGGDDTGSPITYFSCGVCPLYYAGCGANGACAQAYLGVSGHVDVEQATQAAPGAGYATMSNVLLVEWNLADDRPVPDSGCVLVGAATFDAGW
jgi:hypothetical protein